MTNLLPYDLLEDLLVVASPVVGREGVSAEMKAFYGEYASSPENERNEMVNMFASKLDETIALAESVKKRLEDAGF